MSLDDLGSLPVSGRTGAARIVHFSRHFLGIVAGQRVFFRIAPGRHRGGYPPPSPYPRGSVPGGMACGPCSGGAHGGGCGERDHCERDDLECADVVSDDLVC